MVNSEQPPVVARRRPAPPAEPLGTEPTGPAVATVQPPAPVVARRRPAAPAEVTVPVQPATPVVARRRPTVPASTPAAPATPAPVSPTTLVPASVPAPPPARPDPARARTAIPAARPIRAGRIAPAERFDPTQAWHMDDLASACPDPDLAATQRTDPYYSAMWHGGADAFWYDRPTVETWLKHGLLHSYPRQFLAPADAALDRLFDNDTSRPVNLAMLGTLHAWRTASAQQIATFTGSARLRTPYGTSTASALSSHLIDIGLVEPAHYPGRFNASTVLMRPSRSETFAEHIEDRLSFAEWVAITGGQEWVAGGQYDRHNILATELALRAAEYTEVSTILGERFCSIDLLAGSGAGLAPIEGDQRTADAALVRPDGMRIAVEMTASNTKGFARKAERWARLLSERSLSETGLCVVFVVATPVTAQHRDVVRTRNRIYEAVARAVAQFPGTTSNPVAERIGVATWREWFPGQHLLSDDFLTMRVDRPTGTGADKWQQADLLDPRTMPIPAADRARLRAIVDNAALLGQTPFWLRSQPDAPDLVDWMMRRAGLDDLPLPSAVKPERICGPGRPLGHGVGAIGSARPPRRLLGLGAATPRPSRAAAASTRPAPDVF